MIPVQSVRSSIARGGTRRQTEGVQASRSKGKSSSRVEARHVNIGGLETRVSARTRCGIRLTDIPEKCGELGEELRHGGHLCVAFAA
jgi:hypothetical protein